MPGKTVKKSSIAATLKSFERVYIKTWREGVANEWYVASLTTDTLDIQASGFSRKEAVRLLQELVEKQTLGISELEVKQYGND